MQFQVTRSHVLLQSAYTRARTGKYFYKEQWLFWTF